MASVPIYHQVAVTNFCCTNITTNFDLKSTYSTQGVAFSSKYLESRQNFVTFFVKCIMTTRVHSSLKSCCIHNYQHRSCTSFFNTGFEDFNHKLSFFIRDFSSCHIYSVKYNFLISHFLPY